MNMLDIISKKRDGKELSESEIKFFAQGAADDTIADYQLSALLMAIYLNGLTKRETIWLTQAMRYSGETLDLSAVEGVKTDKHSAGGVADTTTLILAPLVAACGAPIVKMSGGGLGFSGGTRDKLLSIPGFNMDISYERAIENARKYGIVIMGQTEKLVPADKKLYALRDVTATVESLPLIASSIMSKKLASGADAFVLDVKCGSGAFMKDEKQAKALAETMRDIGEGANKKVCAVITGMDEPLGVNIGNALEVIEAIETLKGNVGGALLEVSLELGSRMLVFAQKAKTSEEGKELLKAKIKSGEGLNKFKELISAQGGDARVIDDYSLLPLSPRKLSALAETDGFIYAMDTAEIGMAAVCAGAGRFEKDDPIDYGAGIIMKKRLGDAVKKGEEIAVIYAESDEKCLAAKNRLVSAVEIRNEKPRLKPCVREVIL